MGSRASVMVTRRPRPSARKLPLYGRNCGGSVGAGVEGGCAAATMEHRASATIPVQSAARNRQCADVAERGVDTAMEGWEPDVFRAERGAVGRAEECWLNMKEEYRCCLINARRLHLNSGSVWRLAFLANP